MRNSLPRICHCFNGSMAELKAGYFCIVFLLCFDGVALSEEKRLIKHLLDNYQALGVVGRPVFNTSDTINVQYGLALIQILDLDEKNQVLTTTCWNRYRWKDILLQWDPEDYGGVGLVRVPTEQIWTPDIVLYNYADDRLHEYRKASAVVEHTGNVMWIPQAIFKSSCVIDITHFPFDKQECKMKFGSWTYDGFKLDVSFYDGQQELDLNDYIESNEWTVLAHPAYKNTKYYPCCDEPFPDLTFHVKLKRRVAFYNYILILPCVLLSSLTLVLFWLPPESPAKMVLGMNIFVAFFVLLLLLAESTPPAASSIPLIGAYYCLNMILITLSTFLSVIVINLYFRGDKRSKLPAWLKTVFIDVLARVLCMHQDLVHDHNKLTSFERHDNVSNKRKKKRGKTPHDMRYNKFQMYNYKEPSPNPIISSASMGVGNECDQLKHRNSGNGPNSAMDTPLLATRAGAGAGAGDSTHNHADHNHHHHITSPALQSRPLQSVHQQTQTNMHCYQEPRPCPSSTESMAGVESDVREIRHYLRQMMYRVHQREERAKLAQEWKIVALVLDRIFFFMYLAAIIISLVTIFPRTY